MNKAQTEFRYADYIPADTDYIEPPEVSAREDKALKRWKTAFCVLGIAAYLGASTFFWICGYAVFVVIATVAGVGFGVARRIRELH